MNVQSTDEVNDVVDGITYAASSSWIHDLEQEEHWRLYWRQQNLMKGLVQPGDRILEIGPGTGFTTNYLRSKGYDVTTLDLDPGKNPDIVANVVTYPFPERYGAILAFEVFEHIPYDKFCQLLPTLAGACNNYLFLSLPRHRSTPFHVEIKLPRLKPVRWQLSRRRRGPISQYHFWEVEYMGVTELDVKTAIYEAGFDIMRQDELFERMFFACRHR